MSVPDLVLALAGTLTGAALAAVVGAARAQARALGVARAVHELRGPLQAALLATHRAARADPAAGPQVLRGRIAAVGRELERAALALTDLDAAGAGSRRAPDRTEPVDVVELLTAQLETWAAVAEVHGRAVRIDAPSCVPVVHGDPRRIAQGTGNLIANALEHGRGVVTVAVRAHEGGVRIEVADEGPGPATPLRAPRRRARVAPGGVRRHGHGLAVVHAVADGHGGTVRALPGPRGCRVALDLPGGPARAA